MEFSTIRESTLHRTLKVLYSEQYDGEMEVKKYGHVYDIVTKKDEIIEIQTRNLSKLLPKILDTIEKGHNIRLVYPLVKLNRIELKDENGQLISNRKSPKKGCIYDIFKELTGIYPVLLNPHFTLEIVEIAMTEERVRTELAVQTENKRRRFKKNWVKTNKRLDEILNTVKFKTKEDYFNILPENLEPEFSAKDLSQAIKAMPDIPSKAGNNAHLIIWVLSRIPIIEQTQIKNRSHYYKFIK